MDNRNQDLPAILDRYEKGSSSLQDDQVLADYFTGQHSENTQEGLRGQFVYFNNRRNEPLSDTLETRLRKILETPSRKQLDIQLLLRIAAILVVGFGIGWLVFLSVYRTEGTLSTGPGERTRIVLSDGTVVFLNVNSKLIYDRKLDGQTRAVHLKGEAYFEVHRDTLRPFIIHTDDVITEVVGTSFNLRYDEAENVAEISVKSGRVRFGADRQITVVKGEGATVTADRKHVEVVAANPNADAWKTRILYFENAKMTDVIRDVERYFQIRIKTENVSLLDCHFTGKFSNPNVEDVLKVIAYSLNIQYSGADSQYTLSGQHCQQ